MFPLKEWLVAWIAGSILFLSLPLTAIAYAYWRKLAAAGVARRTAVLLAQALAFASPRSEVKTLAPDGPVFCEWDVHWGPSGSGMGTATTSGVALSVVLTAGDSIGRALTFSPEYRRGSFVYGRVDLADGTSGRGAILPLAV